MRKKIVAGNWKMNKDLNEGADLANELSEILTLSSSNVEVILGVPFTHLDKIASISDKFSVSAQNCSAQESGAFTGEVSTKMILSTGAKYVILGHSERRAYHQENNADLAKKVDLCLSDNLKVIYCCGELLSEREFGNHFAVVKSQIEEALFHLSAEQMSRVVIAYEPVWAIGTGVTASSDQAQEMHAYIRSIFTDKYGVDVAQDLSILYGGSCKPSNAQEIFSKEDVDGGLIGGASLNANDFSQIINAF
ncbi:MAG: triose-phosphate isomerase [Flavobacteriales bacterium]|nr:triose-phosphate isomerase [Flavobacteriales bacterium]